MAESEAADIGSLLSKHGLIRYFPKLIMHDFDSYSALAQMDEADMLGKIGMSKDHVILLRQLLAQRALGSEQSTAKRQKILNLEEVAAGNGLASRAVHAAASLDIGTSSTGARNAVVPTRMDIEAKLADLEKIAKNRLESFSRGSNDPASSRGPHQLSPAQRAPSIAAYAPQMQDYSSARQTPPTGHIGVPQVALERASSASSRPRREFELQPPGFQQMSQSQPGGVQGPAGNRGPIQHNPIIRSQQSLLARQGPPRGQPVASQSASVSSTFDAAFTARSDATMKQITNLAEDSAQTTLSQLTTVAEEAATMAASAASFCLGEMERVAGGSAEDAADVDVASVAEVAESALQASQCATSAASSSAQHADVLKSTGLASWAVAMQELVLQKANRAQQSAQECAQAVTMLTAYEQHQQQTAQLVASAAAAAGAFQAVPGSLAKAKPAGKGQFPPKAGYKPAAPRPMRQKKLLADALARQTKRNQYLQG